MCWCMQGTKECKLRILGLFLHDCRYGERIRGDERRFLEIAKRFKDLGAEIYTLEWSPSLQRSFFGEQIYTSLEARPPKLKILWVPYAIIRALLISLRLKYDIIYIHNQDFPNMLVGFILKIILRRPFVVVLHWEYKLFEEGCLRNLRQKRKIFVSLFLLLVSLFVRKIIFPRVDHCFTVSEVVRDHAIRQLGLNASKITTSRNGVNSNIFRPYSTGKIYDACYFGRIDFAQKGIDTLLRVWKQIKDLRSNSKFVLIGGFQGQEDYRRLMSSLDKLDLRNNVKVTGFIKDKEIVRLLNMSKAFVFPTRFDGFALTVLESMSCGLPCIISDTPTMREVYGEVGVFAKPDNYEDFAKTLTMLLGDENEQKRIGKASREFALRHQWEEVARKEFNILSTLVGKC